MFFSEIGAVDEEFITKQNSIATSKADYNWKTFTQDFFFLILKKNLTWKNDSEC